MPRIRAAARALPENRVEQHQVRDLAMQIFRNRAEKLQEHLSVFDHARITSRHLIRPLEWYLDDHSARECNQVYIDEGVLLLERAAKECLENTGTRPEQIDQVIFVSSTGLATPSMESRLFKPLGISPHAKRTPVWGLGCSAGAAGVSLAYDFCEAHPDARVLLLALEFCSLTFRRDDTSLKNLVGTALFADGAAAAVIQGDAVDGTGPHILATHSRLFADTGRIMGWDFDDLGMQLVLSPKLPALIKKELLPLTKHFLAGQNLQPEDIRHYIMHPGGARVIDACKSALGLAGDELDLSEKSLFQYGNVSSVSILMILEDWLATNPEQNPGYGLMSAFGPGFSAEMLLMEA